MINIIVKCLGTHFFHDPWVGTDTPGPGEAVFAIRFIEKQVFTIKNPVFPDQKKYQKIVKNPFRPFKRPFKMPLRHFFKRKTPFRSTPADGKTIRRY